MNTTTHIMDTSLADLSAALSVPRQQSTPRAARTVGRYEDMALADNLKLIFTYIIVLVVVVGGGAMLYAIRGSEGSETLSLAIVGFIGLALGFVFNKESATQATRAAQSSSSQGADQAAIIPHQ